MTACSDWRSKAGKVRLLALDVDGVLTDGSVVFSSSGDELKSFHILDGMGMRLAMEAGIAVAVISGRHSSPVQLRMAELGVGEVLQGVSDKAAALRDLCVRKGIAQDEAAFVGDDLNDLPAFAVSGFRIAVANAVQEVKQAADVVTSRPGGFGAVREAVELILKAQGRWQAAIERFRPSRISES
ncbi:MAG: KdsC family phosphatase [Armatimonadota bacterium]